ncbi:hypothetical protein LTR28_007983, partial [Elasticomyces elasticus]
RFDEPDHDRQGGPLPNEVHDSRLDRSRPDAGARGGRRTHEDNDRNLSERGRRSGNDRMGRGVDDGRRGPEMLQSEMAPSFTGPPPTQWERDTGHRGPHRGKRDNAPFDGGGMDRRNERPREEWHRGGGGGGGDHSKRGGRGDDRREDREERQDGTDGRKRRGDDGAHGDSKRPRRSEG